MKYQVSLYTGNTAEEWAWIQCITKQWNGYYYDPMSWTDTPGGDLGILHKLHLPAVPHHELQALYEAGTIFFVFCPPIKGEIMKALNEQITAYLYLRSKELGITEDSIDQFAYGLAIAKNIGVMRHNIAYNRQLIIASSLEDAIRASYLLLFDNLDAFLTEKTGEH